MRTDKVNDALTINTPLVNASGGTNALTKSGVGTLTLGGANTYTGLTTVNAGTVVFAAGGTMAGGDVRVAPGGAVVINSTALNLGAFTMDNDPSTPSSHSDPGAATLNGSLSAASESINGSGSSFVQNGGANSVTGTLLLASHTAAPSAYTLVKGTLTATSEYAGRDAYSYGPGDGVFNQQGGTNTVSALTVSSFGKAGVYNLSGTDAVLNAQSIRIGTGGTGTFNQSGGTVAISNLLFLGDQSQDANKVLDVGTYTLTGGSLSAPNEHVATYGYAVFNQSGGTHTVSNTLTLCYGGDYGGAGAVAAYTLSGTGLLNTQTTNVARIGPGTGTFTQNGGTHIATTALVVNSGSSTGTYSLNGGLLQTARVTGGSYGGTFNFNGGTLQAGAGSTGFLSLGAAYVQANGAKLDTNGYDLTISQPLLHDPALGTATDGGLTKTGAGTLTLTGANTYTGPTNINNGRLAVGAAGTLGGAGAVNVASGATLDVSAFGAAGYLLPAGRTVTNNGAVAGVLNVNGGDVQGSGSYGGGLTVGTGGTVSRASGTLAVGGTFTNNGTVRFTKGATFDLTGATVINNNGTLDFLTGNLLLPAGVTINNGPNGRVLTSVLLGVNNNCGRNGSTATVTVDGYSGHVYQLQKASSLASGFATVTGVPVQNGLTRDDLTPTPLSFADTNGATAGFYRVAVDP